MQPQVCKSCQKLSRHRFSAYRLRSSRKKGFLPFEGCAEHSFLLRSIFEDSKRRNKTLRVVWLDLKNAFGSVPHSSMWEMMSRLSVPHDFLDICEEIYRGSTQTVKSSTGPTAPLPVTQGIKQGCPLSPLLFNLVLEGILPTLERTGGGYQLRGGTRVRCLAYADDLCIIGATKDDINDSLKHISDFFKWAGLRLNPTKCASLSMINNRKHRYIEEFAPSIDQDNSIPALKWEDTYKYLGVYLGRERKGTMDELSKDMISTAEKIATSRLSEWQKIDAINTFVIPKATYYMDVALLDLTWAKKLDSALRKLVKTALRLPKRTISEFIYVSKRHGGIGLISLEDTLHTTRIMRAIICLSSPDKRVNNVAWAQLVLTVRLRRQLSEVTTEDITDFLNNPPLPQERRSRDVMTLWSSARASLTYLSTSVELSGTTVSLVYDDMTIDGRSRKSLKNILREARDTKRLSALLNATDQGRSFHLISKSWYSNHWIASGAFTSFNDYRFALRARLNLLPTKVVAKRAGRAVQDDTCPRCHQAPETLAHILNACTPNAGLMRDRHNAVLTRLTRAVPDSAGDKYVEQKVKDSPWDLRPDLVVLNDSQSTAVIVDVTIPFEATSTSFEAARHEKLTKYQPVAEWLASRGYQVQVHAFVVGALGAWDPDTDPALKALGIGHNYAKLFRRLCVTDAIKGSNTIWRGRSQPLSR